MIDVTPEDFASYPRPSVMADRIAELEKEIDELENEQQELVYDLRDRRIEMEKQDKELQALREGDPVKLTEWQIVVGALKSIAANTCCESCQEAALVAREALLSVKA